jgi:hypothetical protein
VLLAPAAFLYAPSLAAWVGKMGLLGAAGTGTAISTLHGVALINASLAAIGPAGISGGLVCMTAAGSALGGLTGGMISNAYYGDIKDFSIQKLQDGRGPAVIFINGFLNADENNFLEWERGILKKFPDNPLYGVTWESQALKDLAPMSAKAILALAAKKSLKMPNVLGSIVLLKDLLANPWHVAVSKASQTGVLLAEMIARVEQKDGFILMGHSLGARVIFYILNALSTKEKQYVKDVYLFGGAVGNAKRDWGNAKKAVEGTVYNFYSANDSVLNNLYRPAQAISENPFTSSPIGLSELDLDGRSRSFDVTDQINSHMAYKGKLRELLALTP